MLCASCPSGPSTPGGQRPVFCSVRTIYTKGVQLGSDNYALSTELSGIVIINKDGKIITTLDERSNLFALGVNDLFVDKWDNLWALHDLGLSRIEISSPYRYYNINHGSKEYDHKH